MANALFKPQFLMVCGLSAALVSCSGEGQGSSGPTRFVSIQPIQVCDDLGIFCADLATFEEATRKIWAQANLDVSFLAPNRLNASRFLTIDNQAEFAELSFAGGAGAFGRNPLSTRTSGPISLWFVESIFPSEGLETLGLGWIDQNGVLIDDDILTFNNGVGRLDTVAHEIGHNLGLTHEGLGAGGVNNLMTDGSFRNSPSTLDDITPDGARVDQLTDRQIDEARDSGFARTAPEPSADSAPSTLPTTLPPMADAAPDALPWVAPPKVTPVTDLALLPEAAFAATAQAPQPIPNSPAVTDLALLPEAAFAATAQTSQPIPNGPAMTLLTAGLLAGYLRWQPRGR